MSTRDWILIAVVALALAGCKTSDLHVASQKNSELREEKVVVHQAKAPGPSGPKVSIELPTDIRGMVRDAWSCYVQSECVGARCESYLTNDDRAQLEYARRQYKNIGIQVLADRTRALLFEWDGLSRPAWNEDMSEKMKLVRRQLIFNATVLGHLANEQNTRRYDQLISQVAKACKCVP